LRAIQFIVFLLPAGTYTSGQIGPNEKSASAAEHTANFTQSATLPATPQPQKVIDKKFMILFGTWAWPRPRGIWSWYTNKRRALPGSPRFHPTHIWWQERIDIRSGKAGGVRDQEKA
jgi:hypothetical protein